MNMTEGQFSDRLSIGARLRPFGHRVFGFIVQREVSIHRVVVLDLELRQQRVCQRVLHNKAVRLISQNWQPHRRWLDYVSSGFETKLRIMLSGQEAC